MRTPLEAFNASTLADNILGSDISKLRDIASCSPVKLIVNFRYESSYLVDYLQQKVISLHWQHPYHLNIPIINITIATAAE